MGGPAIMGWAMGGMAGRNCWGGAGGGGGTMAATGGGGGALVPADGGGGGSGGATLGTAGPIFSFSSSCLYRAI